MIAQLVFMDAAVGPREHASAAQDKVNVTKGARCLGPHTTMARGRMGSGHDPRQTRVGADRRDRSAQLLVAPQVHVEVPRDNDVLLRSGQGQELAKVPGDLGQIAKTQPEKDGDDHEGVSKALTLDCQQVSVSRAALAHHDRDAGILGQDPHTAPGPPTPEVSAHIPRLDLCRNELA
eukprot:11094489-Alexandrium_andersonii.AAC.1